jgi:hypothetical protein
MAPSHTSPKKPRLDPLIKPIASRLLWGSGAKKSNYSQSSQSSFEDANQVLEQFRLIRESEKSQKRNSNDEITHKRKSYTRENKLVAINYATTS